ncbi:MAG: LytR C-terminal domain-containing protein [Actinobacteria bacterium]|nr:LytR C-terminal domain-containing protein [Actinomycetota bacterium]
MTKSTAEDRFDNLPEGLSRVGAHRAPRSARSGLIGFAWAALSTFVLVASGVAAMVFVTGTISLNGLLPVTSSTPAVTTVKTAKPTIDPTVMVSVINASGVDGAATRVADQLAADGVLIGTKSNATEVVEKTMVYYGDPAVEGAARGIARALGGGADVERTSAFAGTQAKISVIVGSSYFQTAAPVATPVATETAN